MSKMLHESQLGFRDQVLIDNDRSIVANVLSIQFSPGRVMYELSWMANGASQSGWFDQFRLTQVGAAGPNRCP